jgi:oligosaccharide repeat unit polymerase
MTKWMLKSPGGLIAWAGYFLAVWAVCVYASSSLSAADPTILAVNCLVAVLFLFCAAPFAYAKMRGKVDIFHAKIFIPFVYFLYFGIGPYFYLVRVKYGLVGNQVPEDFLVPVLMLAVAGILFFHVGYFISEHTVNGRTQDVWHSPVRLSQKRLFFFALAALFFFVVVNVLLWKSAGGIPLFLKDYYRESQTEVMSGKGYFQFIALAILPVTLLVLNIYWRIDSRISAVLRIAVYCMVLATLAVLILNVTRGFFLSFIIFSLVNYNYMKKRVSPKGILAFFVGIVLLATVAGYLRTEEWRETKTFWGTVLLLEGAVEFDNYAKTIEIVPESLPLQKGETILQLFTVPIPRALFPGKDEFEPAQVILKEYLGHTQFRIGERLTLVGELFMNFHILGVILGMALFGFAAGAAQRLLYPVDRDPLRVLLYSLTVTAGLAYQIPGDIASVTLEYIQLILPVLFLAALWHVEKVIGKRYEGIAL